LSAPFAGGGREVLEKPRKDLTLKKDELGDRGNLCGDASEEPLHVLRVQLVQLVDAAVFYGDRFHFRMLSQCILQGSEMHFSMMFRGKVIQVKF
jgi:hypothetical protein